MNKQSNQEFEEEDYFTTTHNIEVRLKSPFQSYVMNMAKFFATYFLVGGLKLMPSPSASSKFGLSILNFFKHAQFFMHTQNHFGILKS